MRNLKKHNIMVSAAAMFAAAGFAGNSVFAAEPTTDNFVLLPQMTEQQKADWAKDNQQYREKETQQAERTARMAPKAVTPDEVTNTGRDYCIALLNAEEGRAPRSDENAMMQKDGQPAPSDKANGPRVRRGDRRMPEGQQQPQHRFHRKDGQKDEWKADGQKGEQHFKGEKRDGEHRFDRQDRDGQHREGPKDKRFKHHKNPRFDQQKGNEQGQHKKDHKFGPRDGQPTPPPDAGFQPRPDGQMQPEE